MTPEGKGRGSAIAAFSLVACSAALLACGDDAMVVIRQADGSGDKTPPAISSEGGTMDASPLDEGGAPTSMDRPDVGPPESISSCWLQVGAECDGTEDCSEGQACCGIFDPTRFTYQSVRCQDECEGDTQIPFCSPGESCENPRHECRRSVVVPHDFLLVCFEPLPDLVSQDHSAQALPGQIVCGDDLCEVNQEKCCLRSGVQFVGGRIVALEPYCAPLYAECACDDEPPPREDDAG